MIIDDVSEVLLSADKFKQLHLLLQKSYIKLNECQSAIYELDTLLGTAIQYSVNAKQSQQQQLESFQKGFGSA